MRTYPRRSTCRSMQDQSSVTAPRVSMSLWMARMASRDCKSTPRIASTARRATSRIRPRTSTGLLLKAAEARITRTCKWLTMSGIAALAATSTPAIARIAVSDAARTYVQARAAAINGDHGRSAQLLAALAQSEPAQVDIARKAISEAIGAGQMDLAL